MIGRGSNQRGESPADARRRRVAVLQDIRHRRELPPPPGGWVGGPPRGRSSAPFLPHAELFAALRELGHYPTRVLLDGTSEGLLALARSRASVTFNLVESYGGDDTKDMHVAAYLELLGKCYTGNGPRALHLGQNKPLAKAVLRQNGVPTPDSFTVTPGSRWRRELPFPLIVKPAAEDGSLGIDLGAVVHHDRGLRARIDYLRAAYPGEILVERYLEGREIWAAFVGNDPPTALPLVELDLTAVGEGLPRIAGAEMKWASDTALFRWNYVDTPGLNASLRRRINRVALGAFQALGLRDYARIDLRLDAGGEVYVLEANPNPYFAPDCSFATAWEWSGRDYPDLVQTLMDLALARAR